MQDTLGQILNLIWLKICQLAAAVVQLLDNGMRSLPYALRWLKDNHLDLGEWYCQIVRWVMPILALMILTSIILSLLRAKNPEETWGFLESEELGTFPIHHWETLIGRGRNCDINVEFATISKNHCALIFDGTKSWRVHNLSGKDDVMINGKAVENYENIEPGDVLSIGGVDFDFSTITQEEHNYESKQRSFTSRTSASPVTSITLLTIFQMLTVSTLIINRPENGMEIATSFLIFAGVMWAYTLFNYICGTHGIECEILAFFLCSLCLSVTASSNSTGIYKQLAAILVGMFFFLALSWYLRSLKRTVNTRHLMAIITCVLLAASLVFGKMHFGAQNWIYIAGISFQPSELAKVCFIFAGSASLERLFKQRNIFGFIGLSFFCFGALALMSDFGTGAIFFVTFLVIAFMRSGDYKTLLIIIGTAVAGLAVMLKIKPYIASRFAVWGHAWENASGSGYQQVRTMSASASGGLIGVGSGEGWLHNVAAANTDLVFGMVCEEWGLIIALLAIFAIASMAIFTVRVVRTGRSSYYIIAACAATSLLVFQTMLNVFGSLDMFPLTGVTFPFVSCGGSSMLASWGLLAFIKSADTRQGASFAVRNVKFSQKNVLKREYGKNKGAAVYDDIEDNAGNYEDDINLSAARRSRKAKNDYAGRDYRDNQNDWNGENDEAFNEFDFNNYEESKGLGRKKAKNSRLAQFDRRTIADFGRRNSGNDSGSSNDLSDLDKFKGFKKSHSVDDFEEYDDLGDFDDFNGSDGVDDIYNMKEKYDPYTGVYKGFKK